MHHIFHLGHKLLTPIRLLAVGFFGIRNRVSIKPLTLSLLAIREFLSRRLMTFIDLSWLFLIEITLFEGPVIPS